MILGHKVEIISACQTYNELMKTTNFSTTQTGFTLIEILVVVTIIGIMMVVGVTAFATLQKRGRDARRRGDLQAAQDALEQYFSEKTEYPVAGDCPNLSSDLDADNYMPGGIPDDPKTGDVNYQYACNSSETSYCICASLETGSGNADADDCSSWVQDGDFFCVSNLQ